MTWYDQLDQTKQNEITLARFWRDSLQTATPGANRLQLIADMADTLDAGGNVPQNPSMSVMWDMDHHSQWDEDARATRKDCGPACVETVCKYVTGNDDGPGTDEIMRFITGGYDQSTTMTQLQKAAKELYGVTLKRYNQAKLADCKEWIMSKRPPILLVKYGYFVMRLDQNYKTGHFMVGAGWDKIERQGQQIERFYLHDPDWWDPYTAQGAFIPVISQHLYRMWDGAKDDRGDGWVNPARAALVPAL